MGVSSKTSGIFGIGIAVWTWSIPAAPDWVHIYGPWLALILMAVAALDWIYNYFDPAAETNNAITSVIPEIRPNYAKWDLLNEFKLDAVACLWIDREPKEHLDEAESKQFKTLESFINQGKLKKKGGGIKEAIKDAVEKQKGIAVKASPNWIVEREWLLELANTIHEKPLFLFEKERI
jgi:hypothetical protein